MSRFFLGLRMGAVLMLTGAMSAGAVAQTAPFGTPPAPGTPTANLVLDAMMAAARAASINPAAARATSLNANAAIERYNLGDRNGARLPRRRLGLEDGEDAIKRPQLDQCRGLWPAPDHGRPACGADGGGVRRNIRRAGFASPVALPLPRSIARSWAGHDTSAFGRLEKAAQRAAGPPLGPRGRGVAGHCSPWDRPGGCGAVGTVEHRCAVGRA